MTSAELIEYLTDPALMDAAALPELEKLCGQYPYFYPAQALRLLALKKADDLEFNSMLQTIALQAPDRSLLRLLLQDPAAFAARFPGKEKQEAEPERGAADQAEPEAPAETTSDRLSAENQVPTQDTGSEESGAEAAEISRDYSARQADSGEASSSKPQEGDERMERRRRHPLRAIETEYKLDESDISPEHRLKHQDLIDKFIEENPHISPVRKDGPAAQAEPVLDISYTDEDITDSIFSEGLARIYIRQKEYAKAIRIFEKLNLKYPEKSSYFADQIRFLNKVINNT